MNNKACVIIPARFQSSRFPGKPLVNLLNKPMIIWVAEIAASAVGVNHVYIATDDKRIADACTDNGYNTIYTSSSCLTGTDRVAEASKHLNYDIYINLQGDEPMINPKDILKCINFKSIHMNSIVNGFSIITDLSESHSLNVPKVVLNESNKLIYISRSLVPGCKSPLSQSIIHRKQVCIYGYTSYELDLFSSYGRKSDLEKQEDIEIIRFFEFNSNILMFECLNSTLAVDVPEDVNKVEKSLSLRKNEHN